MGAGPDLLNRRLLFVVGKGGVGKTTFSTALALAALARGKRVLLAEMDLEDRVRPLLGLPPAQSPAASEIRPGFFRMSVDGRTALEEYLGLVIGVRRVLQLVFESRIYQYFVAAAPGLKELMAIGKIWYEVDQGRYDLVIVDCAATGHALQYLRMPKAATETFSSGLVNREARRVWELLSDPKATAVSVVTTAEEMPINETIEICGQLRTELELPEGWLFVNRFHSPAFTAADLEESRRRLRSAAHGELVGEVLRAAEDEIAWGAINAEALGRLEAVLDWPTLVLPFLFREEFGAADVEDIARRVLEGLEEVRAERGARKGGAA